MLETSTHTPGPTGINSYPLWDPTLLDRDEESEDELIPAERERNMMVGIGASCEVGELAVLGGPDEAVAVWDSLATTVDKTTAANGETESIHEAVTSWKFD